MSKHTHKCGPFDLSLNTDSWKCKGCGKIWTREAISQKMTAAEINRRLAEEAMGWELVEADPPYCLYVFKMPTGQLRLAKDVMVRPGLPELFTPFTDITHAFMVVEKMTLPEDEGGLGYYCRMEVLPLADKEARYKCTFYKSNEKLGMDDSNTWKACAATLQAAISLAVLEAKGEKG